MPEPGSGGAPRLLNPELYRRGTLITTVSRGISLGLSLLGVALLWHDPDVRPLPGLGYRQYPRLREDVQSLAGYLQRGVRAPNAGELERVNDLTAEVEKAVAKVNGLITKDIAAINEALKAAPRIDVAPIK